MNTSLQVLHARFFRSSLPVLPPRVLGVVAVLIFAMTIPMTRLANGSMADPQLPPLFVALARSVLGGLLAGAYLWAVRASWPTRGQWPLIGIVVAGGVLVFPLAMGWAVRIVPAAHAAVILGILPLCTAAMAACWLGQRPGLGFWVAGVAGCAVVMAFAAWTAGRDGHLQWMAADAWLVLAMLGAAAMYVSGAALSRQMPAPQVISWALVAGLPLTVPLSLLWWPTHPVQATAWWGLGYVSVFSTWLGFFAWYSALARDPMRVSQLQLLQPFTAIGFAVLLLDEPVEWATPAFALVVLAVVVLGQSAARRGGRS